MKNDKMILDAISLLSANEAGEQNERCIDMLRRFLESNSPSPSGKFDLFNYVAKDELRPILNGIYHKDNKRIATDAMILIVLTNQDYNPEHEGKVLRKDLSEIEGLFPAWECAIPEKSKMARVVRLDYEKIIEVTKREAQLKKENKERESLIIAFNNIGFDAKLLLKIANFAKYKNEFDLYISDNNHAACIYCEDGSIGLIMPKRLSDGEGVRYSNIVDLEDAKEGQGE